MNSTIRKILTLGVVIIITFGLVACGGERYNAVLYDNASVWIHEEFLKDNLTKGAKPFWHDAIVDDEILPENTTHIVIGIDDFNIILKEFPPKVDFEKEMLIVYVCTNIYMGSNYNIDNIDIKDGTLSIKVKRQSMNRVAHIASAPKQRCFIVKMNKNDINTVNFTMS